MAQQQVIRGKNLAVNGESCVDGWMIEHWENPPEYVAGSTGGGVDRITGNLDWQGWYRLYGHPPTIFVNDSFQFKGVANDGKNKGASGTARCGELDIVMNIEEGQYVETTVGFFANSALDFGATSAEDSWIGPLTTKECCVKLNGVKQERVFWIRLRIYAFLAPVVDTELPGQTIHIAGDMNARAEWRVHGDDPSLLPAVGDYITQIYVSYTKCWQLTMMRVTDIRPFGVDRRTRRPVGAHIFAAFKARTGTMMGSIVDPDGATKFP